MTEPSFDPGGFFQFDLAKGSVRSRGGARVLLVSESVLAPLINTAVAHGDLTAVRSLGSQLGTLIASSLGAPANTLQPSQVIGHAGTMMSLFGWGRLRLEQWGDALVLHVDGLPPLDEDNLAVAALLGGMFSTLCAPRWRACRSATRRVTSWSTHASPNRSGRGPRKARAWRRSPGS